MLFNRKPKLKTFNTMLCTVREKEKHISFPLRILIPDQNVLIFIQIFHLGK